MWLVQDSTTRQSKVGPTVPYSIQRWGLLYPPGWYRAVVGLRSLSISTVDQDRMQGHYGKCAWPIIRWWRSLVHTGGESETRCAPKSTELMRRLLLFLTQPEPVLTRLLVWIFSFCFYFEKTCWLKKLNLLDD
jgi:hypothetical protein